MEYLPRNPLKQTLGLEILHLASDFSWVSRREERVELLNGEVTQRSIVAHLDLTERYPDGVPQLWQDRILLPIAIFARHLKVTIDVRSEDGSALPRLTGQEERAFLTQAVLTRAEVILGAALEEETERALIDAIGGAQTNGPVQGEQLRRLTEHAVMMDTVTRVRRWFHLIVPLDPDLGLRRALTYSFLWPIQREAVRFEGVPTSIEIPAAAFCRSYHLLVDAPPSVTMMGGVANLQTAPPASRVIREENDSLLDNQAHVHIENAGRLSSGSFDFRLVPSPGTVAQTAALVSFMAFAAVLAVVVADLWSDEPLEGGSAATLLLLFPGALGPLISSIPRHPLTQTLLRPTRGMLWLSGLASYGAAGAVALPVTADWRSVLLGLAAGVTLFVWVRLLAQWAQLRRAVTTSDRHQREERG